MNYFCLPISLDSPSASVTFLPQMSHVPSSVIQGCLGASPSQIPHFTISIHLLSFNPRDFSPNINQQASDLYLVGIKIYYMRYNALNKIIRSIDLKAGIETSENNET